MHDNQNKILAQYGDGTKEDGRAGSSRSTGLEFHYTKKAMAEHIGKETRVLEIGCATGYYALHFADACKEYVGIDVFPPHIEIFRQKIAEKKLANVSCRMGDAVNLEGMDDNSFDVVCCFGPMYHLPPDERELVFAECARVCKPGGIAAFAYINKTGVYAGACVHDQGRSVYPNKKTNDFVLRLGTDDEKPGVFYFTMPEEMEAAAAKNGLAKLRNMGTDFFVTQCVVDQMDDEKFQHYMELADEMVRYESCTGMSNHALLTCRKGAA
jgi:ubiquinone/menaquinone biosynthesis C-methylase UbiE